MPLHQRLLPLKGLGDFVYLHVCWQLALLPVLPFYVQLQQDLLLFGLLLFFWLWWLVGLLIVRRAVEDLRRFLLHRR